MTRTTTRHGAALAVATLAVTGAIGAATTTSAHAAPISLKIVQHNTDQDKARWNRVVKLVSSGSWDAATVQEVCKGWKDDLVAAHPGWTIAYHEQVTKTDCPGGAKGNVVIRPGAGSRFGEAFDVPGEDKNFGIACVKFAKAGRTVHACSTHLTVYAENPKQVRLGQARRIKQITAKWIGDGHSVVVGGDFNTSPTAAALNPVYKYPTTRSSGRFVEAEQLRTGSTGRVGRNTVKGRKIDYVFFSANRTPLSARGTLTFETPEKGKHKILKATTTLR